MEDQPSRTMFQPIYIIFEEEDELWQQLQFQWAWFQHMFSLELLEEEEELPPPPPPPPPPPREEFEIDYNGLTSFLEVDRSFFSPWNWNTNSPQDSENARGNDRMVFQSPDSFFSEDQVISNSFFFFFSSSNLIIKCIFLFIFKFTQDLYKRMSGKDYES